MSGLSVAVCLGSCILVLFISSVWLSYLRKVPEKIGEVWVRGGIILIPGVDQYSKGDEIQIFRPSGVRVIQGLVQQTVVGKKTWRAPSLRWYVATCTYNKRVGVRISLSFSQLGRQSVQAYLDWENDFRQRVANSDPAKLRETIQNNSLLFEVAWLDTQVVTWESTETSCLG